MDDREQPPPPPPLHGRSSTSASFTIPTKLITTSSHLRSAVSLPHQRQQNGIDTDFDFISALKSPPSSSSSSPYTSLRDVLPSFPSTPAVNSPTTATAATASIRNRLVKQAAWAYLQPMSSSPDSSSSPHFLRRFSACFRFIPETFHRIIRSIRSWIIR